MNASAPRRMIVAAKSSGTLISAEDLGRRIAAVQRKITAVDAARLAASPEDLPVDDRVELALADELAALDLALEFSAPNSLAGIAVLVAQLGVVAEHMAEEECVLGRADLLRRVVRLHQLAMAGILKAGGLDAEEIGAAAKLFSSHKVG